MEKVKAQGALPYVQMAAILHDVTEDTAFTPAMLLDLGIPESAVEIIKLVDRNHSAGIWSFCGDHRGFTINGVTKWLGYHDEDLALTKDEYYYAAIRQNPGALMVKLADIEDNLSPWRLAYLSEDTQSRLKKKYSKAKEILSGRR